MLEKCNLYYYEGLYLNEEEIRKLNIRVVDGIQLTAMLSTCAHIYELRECQKNTLDKNAFISSILKESKPICFTIKGNSLVILPMIIHYGIKTDNQLLAFWNDEKVRDAKFIEAKRNGVLDLITDINNSGPIVDEFQKQASLRKVYSSIKFEN